MKTKKIFSVVLIICVLISTAPFALCEERDDYFSFFEDFSEYNEANAITVLDSGATAEGIEAVWTGLKPTNEVSSIATHSTGATWLSPENSKWFCSYNGETYGRMGISDGRDALVMKGWGDGWTTISKLDLGDNLNLGNVQKTTFTMKNTARESGLTMFIDQNEETFFLFGMRKSSQWNNVFPGDLNAKTSYCPFVAQYNTTGYSLIDYDTVESGWNSANTDISWEIICVEGQIQWSVSDNGGHSWSGYCSDEGLPKKSKYFCGAFTVGDDRSCITSLNINCGDYYNGGLGEPYDVIYKNIAEDVTPNAECVFEQSGTVAPVRRVRAIVPKSETNVLIGLSNDGVSYEEFEMNVTSGRKFNTLSWFNDVNDGMYKYIKLPVGVMEEGYLEEALILSNVEDGATIDIPQYESKKLYLYENEEEVLSADWSSDNENYAGALADGTITGIKDSLIVSAVPTISVTGGHRELSFNACVVGEYTKAINGGSEQMERYISSQQEIINALSIGLAVDDDDAVRKFFTSDWREQNSLSRIDVIYSNEIKNLSSDKMTSFIGRLKTIDYNFLVSSIEDIRNFWRMLLREVYAEEFCNVTDSKKMNELIEDYGDYIGIDQNSDYLKNVYEDAVTALLDTEFKNADEILQVLNSSLVIRNIQSSINKDYVRGLIEAFLEFIGYDEAHYQKQDRGALAGGIIDNKKTISTVNKLREYIDSYTTPTKTTTSPGGGGGGGGGSSKVNVAAVTPVVTDNAEKAPVVEKIKLFFDVETDFWCYEPIRFLVANGAIGGYEDNTFKPNSSVTRAEFLKIALEVFNIQDEISEEILNPFQDLSTDDWYFDKMLTAYNAKIMVGDGVHCNPNSPITREEIAAVIIRIVDFSKKTISDSVAIERFLDDDIINDWARSAVYRLRAAGVVSGTDNMYLPGEYATRAECAAMLYRCVNSVTEPTEVADENE